MDVNVGGIVQGMDTIVPGDVQGGMDVIVGGNVQPPTLTSYL
jgi:hypothetical protein